MAVYGVGAFYDNCGDVSSAFIKQKCACIGHEKEDASSLYEMFRRIKIGDMIYIKSFPPNGEKNLYIKAIGFITGWRIEDFNFPNSKDLLGKGRDVIWKTVFDNREDWIKIELGQEDIVNNVYRNTLYEEYNTRVIKTLIKNI